MGRARELFVQYVNAGGEKLAGLVARRNAEVEWIGNASGKVDGSSTVADAASKAATQVEQGLQAGPALQTEPDCRLLQSFVSSSRSCRP